MLHRKINWPDNKKFAFTIVDDTDNSTLDIIKPVYDHLLSRKILTTKTTWIFKSRNKYCGDTLLDQDYKNYLLLLKSSGFEIALHNVGSGTFSRDEIIEGIDMFKEIFGCYPNIQINHSNNPDNIYWGRERFYGVVKAIYKLKRSSISSFGSDENSDCFWGDICKNNIKYIRNRTFNKIDTISVDKQLVYNEIGKEKYSNYWFSSTDAMDCKTFKKVLTKKNIDKLQKTGGCCILYTHFAYGFVDEHGNLDNDVKNILDYLSSKDGWFVPASDILDFVLNDNKKNNYCVNKKYLKKMDLKWFVGRLFKR